LGEYADFWPRWIFTRMARAALNLVVQDAIEEKDDLNVRKLLDSIECVCRRIRGEFNPRCYAFPIIVSSFHA